MEDGYYSLLDSVDTEDGTHKFYNEIMRDSKKGGYGKITIGEAFVQSSNVGISKITNKFYKNWLNLFIIYLPFLKKITFLNFLRNYFEVPLQLSKVVFYFN